MEKRWYIYKESGEVFGPWTAGNIRAALRDGKVDPFDLVAEEGSAEKYELIEADDIFKEDEADGGVKPQTKAQGQPSSVYPAMQSIQLGDDDSVEAGGGSLPPMPANNAQPRKAGLKQRVENNQTQAKMPANKQPKSSIRKQPKSSIRKQPKSSIRKQPKSSIKKVSGKREKGASFLGLADPTVDHVSMQKRVDYQMNKMIEKNRKKSGRKFYIIGTDKKKRGPYMPSEIQDICFRKDYEPTDVVRKKGSKDEIPVDMFLSLYQKPGNSPSRALKQFTSRSSAFLSMAKKKTGMFASSIPTKLSSLSFVSLNANQKFKIVFTCLIFSPIILISFMKIANIDMTPIAEIVDAVGDLGVKVVAPQVEEGAPPRSRVQDVDISQEQREQVTSKKRRLQKKKRRRASRRKVEDRSRKARSRAKKERKVVRAKKMREKSRKIKKEVRSNQQRPQRSLSVAPRPSSRLSVAPTRSVVNPPPRSSRGRRSSGGSSVQSGSIPVRSRGNRNASTGSSGKNSTFNSLAKAKRFSGQVVSIGPLSFSPTALANCSVKCTIQMSDRGGRTLSVKFFKAAYASKLNGKQSGVYITGLLGEQGSNLYLQKVK